MKATGFKKIDSPNFRGNGADATSEIEKVTPNVDMCGSDSSSPDGKTLANQMVEAVPTIEIGLPEVPGNEKVETGQYGERHQRKRKRTLMNDKQIAIMERALVGEPDMQRNAASLIMWADKLSMHGSEVTTAQLKNWLNNRKARLARGRLLSESDNPDGQGGSGNLPLNSLLNTCAASPGRGNQPIGTVDAMACSYENSGMPSTASNDASRPESMDIEKNHHVMIMGIDGKEIGVGVVFQVHGIWYGKNLRESGTSVVDIVQLWVQSTAKLPYPSESTGTSFEQAKEIHGQMRVLWDMDKLSRWPPE